MNLKFIEDAAKAAKASAPQPSKMPDKKLAPEQIFTAPLVNQPELLPPRVKATRIVRSSDILPSSSPETDVVTGDDIAARLNLLLAEPPVSPDKDNSLGTQPPRIGDVDVLPPSHLPLEDAAVFSPNDNAVPFGGHTAECAISDVLGIPHDSAIVKAADLPDGTSVRERLDEQERQTTDGPTGPAVPIDNAPKETPVSTIEDQGVKRFKLDVSRDDGKATEVYPGYALGRDGMDKRKGKEKVIVRLFGPENAPGEWLNGSSWVFEIAKNKTERLNEAEAPFKLTLKWHKNALDDVVLVTLEPKQAKPKKEDKVSEHKAQPIGRRLRNYVPEMMVGGGIVAVTLINNLFVPEMQQVLDAKHLSQIPVVQDILASGISTALHAGAYLHAAKAHLYQIALPAIEFVGLAWVVVHKTFMKDTHEDGIKKEVKG